MIANRPGRTGHLYYTPPDAPGADRAALVRLIAAISTDAVGSGLYFVQCLTDPGSVRDIGLLEEAGYESLAELAYMRKPLDEPIKDRVCRVEGIGWRRCDASRLDSLAWLIPRTYEGSMDCPRLSGLRDAKDIIEGHKGSGPSRPEAWWMVVVKETPVGCVLVNDGADCADIAYLGVVPEYRRLGLGSILLTRAAVEAKQRGMTALTVAVDAANTPAVEAYRRFGFAERFRRRAYIVTRSSSGANRSFAGC